MAKPEPTIGVSHCHQAGRKISGPGFTLVEVIVALGIAAVGVTTVVALLATLGRMSGELKPRTKAAQLGDAIAMELQQLRAEAVGDAGADALDVLAARIPFDGSAGSFRLVASRDGLRLYPEAELGTAPDFPPAERFFLVELRQKAGTLAYASGAGFLAVTATVSWPYVDSATTENADVSFVTLNMGITR